MKTVFLLSFLPLAGCGWSGEVVGLGLAGASVGSVATIQRTPADAVYSLLTGRDCSIVRLDQGKGYCRATGPAPALPEFCTRSLAWVDCWQDPAGLPGHPRGVADGAAELTPAQEADRVRGWLW